MGIGTERHRGDSARECGTIRVSGSVTLPEYTLLTVGMRYEVGRRAINLACKNCTDARYFRSNFPDLFGSSVVLPELPRNYTMSGQYRF
jgi:iron complex outermembrane receptor protein